MKKYFWGKTNVKYITRIGDIHFSKPIDVLLRRRCSKTEIIEFFSNIL